MTDCIHKSYIIVILFMGIRSHAMVHLDAIQRIQRWYT